MNPYLWLDHTDHTAPECLAANMVHMLRSKKFRRRLRQYPLIFLCIGTPKIPGDCLGPLVGSLLMESLSQRPDSARHDALNAEIFGTLKHPVHALNLRPTLRYIRRQYPGAVVIAIDAAVGSKEQNGFVTLKKGALKPGRGLGKKLPAVGHIQITGVFSNLYGPKALRQMACCGLCITRGLAALRIPYTSFKNQTFS